MASPQKIMRPKRQPWSRPLAELIGAVIDPVLAKQGFGESAIILHWEDIVGARIARASQPLKLQWPPRGARTAPDARTEPATLIVQVEGAFALELQHQGALVVERVNAHLGWRCIGRLALRQGPMLRRADAKRPKAAIEPDAFAAAQNAASGIENADLREALARLGARALAKAGKKLA